MELFKEKECPDCGIPAPARQIKTLGNCERCEINFEKTFSPNLNPEKNVVDKWKSTLAT